MKRQFIKSIVMLIGALCIVPLIIIAITHYNISKLDRVSEATVARQYAVTHYDKSKALAFIAAKHTASHICETSDPELVGYSQAVCPRGSSIWQLVMMEKGAWGILIAGFGILVAMGLLGALAFKGRRGQLLSVRIALPLLKIVGTLMVVALGIIGLWLGCWIALVAMGIHDIRLFVCIGLVVICSVLAMVASIFTKIAPDGATDAEVLSREQAPALWERVDRLAQQVGTTPPDNIVVGIDDNFYVMEAPMHLEQCTLEGRTLFVSIPLLRQLSMKQADSVMVHELTHLHKGDTKVSAALGPLLHRFDRYTQEIHGNYLAWGVYLTLITYRFMFELASSRERRQREYIADRTAAELIGPQYITEALIKLSAYSAYRGEVERGLFNHDDVHEELRISRVVMDGLDEYARSSSFIESINEQNTPHPFDSHPVLGERMKNAGHIVDSQAFPAIATATPTQTWVDLMPDGDDIESRMWQRYEALFQSSHEELLAWKYLPATEEEVQLVQEHFPVERFSLKRERTLDITYEGLLDSTLEELITWDNLKKVTFHQSYGVYTLIIKLHDATSRGKKTVKIRLTGKISKNIEAFQQTFQRYWDRRQHAQAYHKQSKTS